MKIAFIGQKGIPAVYGGVERHVEELAFGLFKSGHKVYAYTRPNYTDPKLGKYKGVNLISLPSVNSKNLDAISHTFFACLDTLRRDFDVIHFHSIGPSSLIILAKILNPRTPVIATFHSRDYYQQKWGLLARMYLKFGEWVACRLADRTIVVSNGLKEYADEKYGCSADYIPNGVNINGRERTREISKWGLRKNGYILAVSRLVRHKGLQHLVKAYNSLKTTKKLVIAGDGSYTDQFVWELQSLAAANPNIIFTGNQTGRTLTELYSNASFFVQPSESEGLSIALLEAMSFGKPVLVSSIKENLEAAGGCGFVFKNKDADDLSDKMQYILNNQEEAEAKASLGVERVRNEYSWEEIVEKTVKLYKTALREKRGSEARQMELGFNRWG